MKIGILGTGDVGRVLGKGFAGLGYDVKMGSRDPRQKKVTDWVAKVGAKASAGTFAEAASFGDVLVPATLLAGTENALKLAGPENTRAKVVIDATHPPDFSAGMPPRLTHGHNDSGGEQVRRWLPEARVVKCFNIVGNANMVQP
jgi:predicted dinucleotide-binding enzyme